MSTDRPHEPASGRLPNFFLIGAQKSGTTSLHRYLQAHPEIFLCDPKEPQFFSATGERDLAAYRRLFAGAGTATAVGEASTTYSMYPFYAGVPARLTAVVPNPRLVYLIRDPVDRMRSAYQHGLAGGTETRPLEVALRADPRYLLMSSYSLQIEQWLAVVPRDRLLLLDFDRLIADPAGVVAEVLRFLGVSADWTPPQAGEAFNDSAGKRAPRGWWRTLGEGMRRAETAGGLAQRLAHSKPVIRAALRLHESDRQLARREIPAAEVAVGPDLDRALRHALAADLRRLRSHWGPSGSPAWLEGDTLGR